MAKIRRRIAGGAKEHCATSGYFGGSAAGTRYLSAACPRAMVLRGGIRRAFGNISGYFPAFAPKITKNIPRGFWKALAAMERGGRIPVPLALAAKTVIGRGAMSPVGDASKYAAAV